MLTDRVRFEELTDEHVRQALREGRAIIIFENGSSLWNRVLATGPLVFDSDPESPGRRLQRPFEISVARSKPSEFERRFQEVTEWVDRIKRAKS